MNGEGGAQSLENEYIDAHLNLQVFLYFTVYEHLNVITRHAKFASQNEQPLILQRALSTCEDYGEVYGFNLAI